MPESTSEKLTRAEAARRNGAKSKGPKTAAGKERSSRNALKHGLTAVQFRDFLVANENPDRFEAVYRSVLDTFRPATPLEEDIVREIAWARWTFFRNTAIQAGLLDAVMDNQADALEQVCPGIRETTRLACAFEGSANKSRSFDLLLRYFNNSRRSFSSAVAALDDVQKRRLRNETQSLPNEPNTPDLPSFFRNFRRPEPAPAPSPAVTTLVEPAAVPAPSPEPAPAPLPERPAAGTRAVSGYLPRVTGVAPRHRSQSARRTSPRPMARQHQPASRSYPVSHDLRGPVAAPAPAGCSPRQIGGSPEDPHPESHQNIGTSFALLRLFRIDYPAIGRRH